MVKLQSNQPQRSFAISANLALVAHLASTLIGPVWTQAPSVNEGVEELPAVIGTQPSTTDGRTFILSSDKTTVGVFDLVEQDSAVAPDDFRIELIEGMNAARNLENGWSGEDSVVPSNAAIDDALAFLNLVPTEILEPGPLVSGDGEVGFYWKAGRAYIDVGFSGDKTISFFARDKEGRILAADDQPFLRRVIPRELLDSITIISDTA